MTIKDLLKEYISINNKLDKRYLIQDKEKKIFIYVTKIMEEMGELSEVILLRAGLQRSDKDSTEVKKKLEGEFADVLGTVVLLGLELEVDIEQAIKSKIADVQQRFEKEEDAKF